LENWVRDDSEIFNNTDATVRYLQLQLEDYISALENGDEPAMTGADGRRTVELITAIYKSSQTNMPVKFPL
jgi:predicted dehydrogenase